MALYGVDSSNLKDKSVILVHYYLTHVLVSLPAFVKQVRYQRAVSL